jgi:hypothetical protein
MDLEVRWSPEATEDIEAIAEYIERDYLNTFQIGLKVPERSLVGLGCSAALGYAPVASSGRSE